MIVLNSASVRREAVCVSDCNAGAGSHCPIRVQVELADHVDVVGIDEIGNGCFRRTQTRAINAAPLLRVTICRELRHSDQIIKSEHVGTDRRRKYAGPQARNQSRFPRETTPGLSSLPPGSIAGAIVVSGIATKTFV